MIAIDNTNARFEEEAQRYGLWLLTGREMDGVRLEDHRHISPGAAEFTEYLEAALTNDIAVVFIENDPANRQD